MARAIIRFSLDGDDGTETTRIRNALSAAGFTNVGTSLWETTAGHSDAFMPLVNNLVDMLGNLPDHVHVDHLWVYLNKQ